MLTENILKSGDSEAISTNGHSNGPFMLKSVFDNISEISILAGSVCHVGTLARYWVAILNSWVLEWLGGLLCLLPLAALNLSFPQNKNKKQKIWKQQSHSLFPNP